ncbi:MAG: carboxypeptidase regulatory-like domain-containing protein [Deltaproteobacteria bacterium]|nr:carboxypeptidase regulatory-like domain-containing protein [Deltaproteobacteria bacterium]
MTATVGERNVRCHVMDRTTLTGWLALAWTCAAGVSVTHGPAQFGGRVVDELGLPVGGTRVILGTQVEGRSMEYVAEASTDPFGQFVFLEGPSPGPYFLQVQGQDRSLAVELPGRDIKVVVEGDGVIRGRFVDQTDRPVEGAEVELDCLSRPPDDESWGRPAQLTWTDRDGTFSFSHVLPGNYKVVVEAFRRSTAKTLSVAEDEVVEAQLHGGPLASITGKVVDQRGRPLSRVSVFARMPPREQAHYEALGPAAIWPESTFARVEETGEDGTFTLADLSPGVPLRLVAKTTEPPTTPESSIDAEAGDDSVVLVLDLEAGLRIELERAAQLEEDRRGLRRPNLRSPALPEMTAKLRVKVLSASGTPVPRVSVSLAPLAQQHTDDTGTAFFDSVPAGRFVVSAYSPRGDPQLFTKEIVTVSDAELREVAIRERKGGATVDVAIYDFDGRRTKGRVALVPANESGEWSRYLWYVGEDGADADGIFVQTVRELPLGSFTLHFGAYWGPTARELSHEVPVSFDRPGRQTLELRLPRDLAERNDP